MRQIVEVVMLAGAVFQASAQPEPWLHPDGTIHYYHAIPTPGGLDWYSARDCALGHGGYLATLTSQVENGFVFGLVDTSSYWYQRPGSGRWAGPRLGGFQPSGSREPDSGWTWIDFEPFLFRNWSPGEPDNAGDEDALNFGELTMGRAETWNNVSSADTSIRGFVRELSADTTTLGLTRLTPGSSTGYTLFSPQQSSVDEIVPACDSTGAYPRPAPGIPFGPAAQTWVYGASPATSFYASYISGAQRLPDGNTQICEGDDGIFFEVTHDSQTVWRYANPATDSTRLFQGDTVPNGVQGRQSATFRAPWYPPDYPGLAGHDLTPGYPLENYGSPPTAIADRPRPLTPDPWPLPPGLLTPSLCVAPNPCSRFPTLSLSCSLPAVSLKLSDATGKLVRVLCIGRARSGVSNFRLRVSDFPQGVYLVRLETSGRQFTRKLILE